ncbi:MFS transporter, putative [Talaromyces stipitatus ATCC 10500]|uniref:MFS transporter, putative n=1 Tax=Talaromyces stipitatus (strain ATCC 10500 / CBS 375.48 / QM 6759 / NRRL 1006) TaxID=441959 RepID=B8MRN7_TALSN|nr:MFS transporter, putative [Talaromyces stipitatus ATCC 10500]EED13194.1 MFS transporter, putative [Talaromyces stipitatus ATCC 10500]
MVIGSLHTQRVISGVAATLIALASGTNYAYSAWAPQFAERMVLSSKQSNMIGIAGNIGLYCSGFFTGYLTDTRGPRPTLLLGALALFWGYYPLYLAYNHGQDFLSLSSLCFFSWLTGLGGSAAFSGAIKAAASNFPEKSGTATAFPLAAFGLSAFFFSSMAAIFYHGQVGPFLLMLAVGTALMVVVFGVFLRILPPEQPYTAVPERDGEDRHQFVYERPAELGRQRTNSESSSLLPSSSTPPYLYDTGDAAQSNSRGAVKPELDETRDADDASSLLSKPESLQDPQNDDGHGRQPHQTDEDDDEGSSHYVDVKGLALFTKREFWQQFIMMALLSGIGLMTINNIGNNTKALWRYYDDSADSKFIQHRQVMHVSILSFCSFLGRLLSGVGSDFLVHRLNMSRFWCIFLSSVVFTLTQIAGTSISNPNHLYLISSFTGLAYGFLFGVFPSVVAHTFGMSGLSQNWGVVSLAPVLSGNIFNLLYGAIYDHHSIVGPQGQRDCSEGLQCYRSAYWLTFFSGLGGMAVALYCIWQERQIHGPRGGRKTPSHERLA